MASKTCDVCRGAIPGVEPEGHTALCAEVVRQKADAELDAKHAKLVEVANKLRAERTRSDALVAALSDRAIRDMIAEHTPSYEALGRVRIAVEVILAARREIQEEREGGKGE